MTYNRVVVEVLFGGEVTAEQNTSPKTPKGKAIRFRRMQQPPDLVFSLPAEFRNWQMLNHCGACFLRVLRLFISRETFLHSQDAGS